MTGLTIGSWPGVESGHNRFLPILLGALEAEGARIVSFPASRDIAFDGLDALIVHWPDKVFWEADNSREASRLMLRLLVRLATRPRRVKLIWMVHDLAPHDGKWFKRLAWPPYAGLIARMADGALTLAEGTRGPVRAAYPALAKKPLGYIWHPCYPGEAVAPEARTAARAALGWTGTERVYGYCGQLRPYKGVEELIGAFAALDDPCARLLIAGRPRDEAMVTALRRLAGDDPRIHLKPQDLAREAFRACLGACDIVVAPFRRYLHSGSLVHSLSAQRPVLTPSTPFAQSLADALASPGWIQTYTGDLTPARLAAATIPAGPLDLGPLAPLLAARRILEFIGSAPAQEPMDASLAQY